MIFEKAIRRRQVIPSNSGHKELDTPVISENPEMMLKPNVADLRFVEELADWPEVLDLLVEWRAVPLDNFDIEVQDVTDGQPLSIRKYYDPQASDQPSLAHASRYKGISFLCRDVLAETYGLNGVFFSKDYTVQDKGPLIQHREAIKQGLWKVTPPIGGQAGENLLPLLAYGCHAPLGGRLADIQQVYANIGTNGKDTLLRLYRESDLRQTEIVQPVGGTINGWNYQFMEPRPQTSLIGDIMEQRVQLVLTQGEVTRTYVSVSYQDVSENDQLIRLTFKPK